MSNVIAISNDWFKQNTRMVCNPDRSCVYACHSCLVFQWQPIAQSAIVVKKIMVVAGEFESVTLNRKPVAANS